jgi:hypothetical protein
MNWLKSLIAHWRRPGPPAPHPPKVTYPKNEVTDLLSSLLPGTLASMPPALKQEQFADTHAAVRREDNRLHNARLRLIAVNNSAVERDYGRWMDFGGGFRGRAGSVDESKTLREELFQALREDSVTEDEYAKLAVTVVGESSERFIGHAPLDPARNIA